MKCQLNKYFLTVPVGVVPNTELVGNYFMLTNIARRDNNSNK